jgi:hypothetical protein
MSVEFEDGLSARQVEELISKLEERVRSAHPEVVSLLVKPQNPEDFQDAHRRRFGDGKASPSDRAPV